MDIIVWLSGHEYVCQVISGHELHSCNAVLCGPTFWHNFLFSSSRRLCRNHNKITPITFFYYRF